MPESARRTHFQPTHHISDLARRLIDITISSIGLLLLSPLFIWLAWKIKRDSPGPIFYRGPRLGRGGNIFYMFKFRTMYEDSHSYTGPRLTTVDDPRVTPLGRWLRDTKLNELPQLWNVLAGEMSLVGPRPEDPEIGARWPRKIRDELLSIRPGITSPASVRYHHEETLLQSGNLMQSYFSSILPTKLRLDQLYVRRRSLLLDLDVIYWTFRILLPRQTSYAQEPNRMFKMPDMIGAFTGLLDEAINDFPTLELHPDEMGSNPSSAVNSPGT